jgi:hypothetical protein
MRSADDAKAAGQIDRIGSFADAIGSGTRPLSNAFAAVETLGVNAAAARRRR